MIDLLDSFDVGDISQLRFILSIPKSFAIFVSSAVLFQPVGRSSLRVGLNFNLQRVSGLMLTSITASLLSDPNYTIDMSSSVMTNEY